ncbi:Fe-S cluster assembly protein SufD [Lichenicoccus roseus]|uniref:Fe-S cluster assembly protein SufD n=1 Tax=Lichenicoccus roseus TaxID=2683649 RepID=A0A5R9J557_9PROT|nr:Fe-S cluster assembly protein SufD [Lichenicoccus roseus]TLU72755.1 Fe-S cluster assembly protein SufD [Lichenicoccus roseus]
MNAIDGNNAAQFLALHDRRGSSSALSEAGAAALRHGGLPRRDVEAWKYTDLRPLTALAVSVAEAPSEAVLATANGLLQGLQLDMHGLAGVARLVFVNGHAAPSLSLLPDAALLSVQDAPAEGSLAPGAMAALNATLGQGGAALRVPGGVDAGRLLLLTLGVGEGDGAVTAHPHHRILLEPGSRLSLLEIAAGHGLYVNNPVLEVELRNGAHLTHVRLQDEAVEALHLSTVRAEVAEGGSYDSFSLALGARLARHEVHATMSGRGAEVQVNGAQLLDGQQHADLTSVIVHKAPACNSRQTVKNVLSGRSRAVFQGKIVVERIAQKTDGYQMNQALLLSNEAEIDTKPELEIYADDVKCSHGATAGALDDDQLFYLRSRGVPVVEARAILVRAFLADALGLIDDEVTRGVLERAVDASWDRRSSDE